jgi:hypothetical protein
LQEDFRTVGFLLKDLFEGIASFDMIVSNFMNITNLSMDVGGRQRFRRRTKNIFEALPS